MSMFIPDPRDLPKRNKGGYQPQGDPDPINPPKGKGRAETRGDVKVVTFKSVEPYFTLERSGEKPCTVRVMDAGEFQQDARGIMIMNEGYTEGFIRRLTWSGIIGTLLGKDLVVFCWHPRGDEL